MSVKEQDTGIPLGQNSSKVAGGEKDRSKITIALTLVRTRSQESHMDVCTIMLQILHLQEITTMGL